MPHEMPEQLRELADRQCGVVSRSQAMSAGLSKDLIRSRLERQRWQRMHTGVYATFTGVPDRQATLWAAVLRAGPGAALSFQTAAELDRLIDKPSSLIHVTIPASRRVAPIRGVIVHLRHDADRAAHPTRLPPRTRLEETVLDLAGGCQDVCDAIDWVARALGRRLTKQSLLREAMDRRSKLAWRVELKSLLTADAAGIHSALEYRYHRYVEAPHRLPRGKRQVRVTRNSTREYRDVTYEEYALVVELDGQVAHPGDTRWLDIRRDNAAAATGALTLRYGYEDLTVAPCMVAVQVSQVLEIRGWRGTARPCSPGCPINP
jgi:very-short-patch-repair endonuclease